MIVNVAELMTDPDFTSTIVLRRPAPARLANEGENIATYLDDVNVTAIVQPATAEDVLSLPEGDRGSGRILRVWSATALQMADGVARDADVLVVGGDSFRVVGEQKWDGHGYRFVLAKEFIP